MKVDPQFVSKEKYETAKAKASEEFERKKNEVLSQLKGFGNSILGELIRKIRNESGQFPAESKPERRIQHIFCKRRQS